MGRVKRTKLRVGEIEFDHAAYDDLGDVLYLHVGEPRPAADGDATPEGHALRFDAGGRIIGLTIINARWLLQRDREIKVTLPREEHIGAGELADVLSSV